MTRPVESGAYLIIEGLRQYGPVNAETGERDVSGASVVGYRKYRPKTLTRDQIAVRVTLRLPPSIFNNPTPAVVIDVPEDFVVHGPIEVTVVEPEQ
jgi:hypothetical protein